MPSADLLRAYAGLLLDEGIALRPGQCLGIQGEPVHWDFHVLLAEEAYRRGARYVRVEAQDPRLARARIDLADEASLAYVPPYIQAQVQTLVDERWSRISLNGSAYPDAFRGADAARNAAVDMPLQKARKPALQAALGGACRWCVAALPTPAWAAKVLGVEPSDAAAEELWRILIPILRLDREDPQAAWREQAAALGARAAALTSAGYDAIRFTGPGTDLTVGLIPGARWCGGALTDQDGVAHVPNLPTEEVFTTPDHRRTQGRVAVTRPVKVLGSQVRGAWFVFDQGRVVDFGADEGSEELGKYFAMDERARYLGEVALVDGSSPIFQSGRVFESILYDENAACHVALGTGITSVLPSSDQARTDDDLLALGCNVSLVHTDFMIGSGAIDVTGITASGAEHPIIREGSFVA